MPRSPSAGYRVYGQDVPGIRSYENGYANVQGRPRQQAKLRRRHVDKNDQKDTHKNFP